MSILNFMYKGEVNVNQSDLQHFLLAAEELHIKGLSTPPTVLKEVLRRENQGLKVYPVDRSSVFSMTGTYF
jgi:hypothetical protein